MLLIFLFGLLHTTIANLTTTTLFGNLYVEDVGKVHLYHDTWTLIMGVNLTNTQSRLYSIRKSIQLAGQVCNHDCIEAHEINVIELRLRRLQQKEDILSKLLGKPKRTKRGLVNFVGDISKTLFGTLSNSDLDYIDGELDKLYTDNKNIATALTNHTKILKSLLDSSSADYKGLINRFNEEEETALKLTKSVNNNTKSNFINTKLVMGALLIDELNEDIDVAINAINDGKHGIIHPQILTPHILRKTIDEFETKHRTRYHLDNTEDNYQHIIDISNIQVAIIQGLFTYVVKIPVLEQEEGMIKRFIPLPERIFETFLAIIPDHEYLISYQDSFSPTDANLLRECKQIDDYKICERKQPLYKIKDTNTCDSSLLKRYADIKCNKSPYLLHKETYIFVENGYIIIPTGELEIDALCPNELKTIKINRATLITGAGCKLHSANIELKLPEFHSFNKIITVNVTYELNFERKELELLKNRLIQLPQQVDNDELLRARLSLDDTENMLSKISSHRRMHTWTERSLEWLKYLGYFAITLITCYLFYKCGILDLIKTCIPSKICLFCVKTKVNTTAIPHVVTYRSTPTEEPLLKNRIVRFSKQNL